MKNCFLTSASALFLSTTTSMSQEVSDLGTLLSDNIGVANSLGMSANGSTVVGVSNSNMSSTRAFRWTSSGMQDLGTLRLNNSGGSFASAASSDGSVVVGRSESDGTHHLRAFRWTSAGMVDLGSLRSDNGRHSRAADVSYDGNTVVGTAAGDISNNRAFRWTASAGMEDLGTLRTNNTGASYGHAMSADGQVVVGAAHADFLDLKAFRWTSSGMENLGTLRADNTGLSSARGVSADGNTVAGLAADDDGNTRAFRWTASAGMEDLGTLRADNSGDGVAEDLSADGGVIVGSAASDYGADRAFRWTTASGMEDLGTLAADNSGESFANEVSADGSIIIGAAENDDGNFRAVLWRRGAILDHGNTLLQVAQNALQQAAASTVLTDVTEFALGQEISAPRPVGAVTRLSTKGDARSRLPIAVRVSLAGAANSDTTDAALAGVTAAAALSPSLTIGSYLGLGQEIGSLEGFGIDGRFNSYGVYLRGNPSGDTGLTWKLALAQTGSDVDITRAASLTNTEAGSGDSNMTSRAASFELGYAFLRGKTTLTPFSKLTRTTYQRDGYTENNGIAFPVSYDTHKQDATFATLGLNAEFAAGERGMISITGGLELDLNRSQNPVTGTSAIPGATSFSVTSPTVENSNRAFASARYTHALNNDAAVDFSIGFKQSAYTSKPTAMASVGYQMNF